MSNFITNGGFESGETGWTFQFGATTATSPTPHKGSTIADLVLTDGGGPAGVIQTIGTATDASTLYYVSVWLRQESADDNISVELTIQKNATNEVIVKNEINSDGSTLWTYQDGTTKAGKTHTSMTGRWFNVSFGFRAPDSDTLKLRVQTAQAASGASGSWYVDKVWFGDTWPEDYWAGLTGHLPRLALRSLVDPVSGEYYKEDDVEWDIVRNEWRGRGEADQPGQEEYQDWYERPDVRDREPL